MYHNTVAVGFGDARDAWKTCILHGDERCVLDQQLCQSWFQNRRGLSRFCEVSEQGTVGHAAAGPMVGTVPLSETGFETSSSLPAGNVAAVLAAAPAEVQFHRDIRPILSNHCFRCHGPDAEARQSGLRLDTREGPFGAGDSGATIVAPGEPAASELWRRITATHPSERMPPAEARLPLSEAQLAAAALDRRAAPRWRESLGLRTPQCARHAGVRDGGGPPPTGRSIHSRAAASTRDSPASPRGRPGDAGSPAVVRPDRPAAGAAAVDGVRRRTRARRRTRGWSSGCWRRPTSASGWPCSGSTWCATPTRCGYHGDDDQPISPYRDYVIKAFNDNLPFDQFTLEQLAGDLLPEPTQSQRDRHRLQPLEQDDRRRRRTGQRVPGQVRRRPRADTSPASGWRPRWAAPSATITSTIPTTTRDFYSFAAFFADVEGARRLQRRRPPPGARRADARTSSVRPRTSPRTIAVARSQARRRGRRGRPNRHRAESPERNRAQAATRTLRAQASSNASFPRTMVTVATTPREMRILPRGNWLDDTGPIVEPALPAFLGTPVGRRPPPTRLDLAHWLVARRQSADRPRVRQSAVEAVLRRRACSQLDDFGAQGEPPDPSRTARLAGRRVHRQRLGREAHDPLDGHAAAPIGSRRSHRPSSCERDPHNRLFARQARFRLEAELIRDQALATQRPACPHDRRARASSRTSRPATGSS